MADLDRRSFLTKAGLAAAGIGALAAGCAKSAGPGAGVDMNTVHHWNMVTTWPPGTKVLHEGAEMLAKWIEEMSGGRIKIRVWAGGEKVPPMQVFDAVRDGSADIGHGASYYWFGKVPAAPFFCAVPFGMNAQQMNAWLYAGGGIALWEEVYAQYGLVPMPAGNTGVQMAGWFNREINSPEDLKGLKMRIPGLGGKVMAKAGVAVTTTPPAEIFTSLSLGTIDAAEWVGPYHDYVLELHKADAAKYYYYPGWQEPGSVLELIINADKFAALSPDLQAIVRAAAARSNHWILAEFEAKNNEYLSKIKAERGNLLQFRKLPDSVLDALRGHTAEVLAELIGDDPMSKKVYASFTAFQKNVKSWAQISERAYFDLIEG